MSQQKYPKAYEAYQQAVYRDGRNPTFWCSIGVLYYQINQYRDALDAYSRAIRLNPFISEVWYDLGTLVSLPCPSHRSLDNLLTRFSSTRVATTRSTTRSTPIRGLPNSTLPTLTSRLGYSFSATTLLMACRPDKPPCPLMFIPKPTKTVELWALRVRSGQVPRRSNPSRLMALHLVLPVPTTGEGSRTSTRRRSPLTRMPQTGSHSVAVSPHLFGSLAPGSKSRCGRMASQTGRDPFDEDPRRLRLTMRRLLYSSRRRRRPREIARSRGSQIQTMVAQARRLYRFPQAQA